MVYKQLSKGKPGIGKPDCPECKSKQTLFKRTTRTHWCRACGAEFQRNGNIVKQEGR